jgi:hypothetical protein
LASGYCISNGIPNYTKIANLLLFISFTFILYFFISATSLINIENLKPIIQLNSLKQINIMNFGIITYLGIEMILFLAPFLKNQNDMKKNIYIAICTSVSFFLLDIVYSIGILEEKDLYYQYFPVFSVAKEITYEPYFELRSDILFAFFWFMLAYIVMVGYHYLSSLSVANIINSKNYIVYTFLLIPLFYTFSILPQNLSEVENALRYLEKFWLYGIIGSILLVFMIGTVRKKIKWAR